MLTWCAALREGSSRATEKLWRLYFERMVTVARRKVLGSQRAAADEEDIALSAFKSFCLAFQQGRFEVRDDSENLWPLLVTLTINKAIDHLRKENRSKRRPARTGSDGGIHRFSAATADALDELVSAESPPELAAAAAESFEQLLDTLDETGDLTLRQITLESVAGRTTTEIARELDCTPRTIQRKLQTVRAVWERLNP